MSSTQRTQRNLRLLSLAVFCAGWELLARMLSSMFVPSFFDTAAAFLQLVSTRPFWHALWISHQAFVLGFGSALVLGLACGWVAQRTRSLWGAVLAHTIGDICVVLGFFYNLL